MLIGQAGSVWGENRPLTRLVVADAISIHHLNLYVAQEKGLFRKHGLDVTINDVRGIPQARDQVLSGKADLFWSCPTVPISAIAGGAPLKIISQVKTPCSALLLVPKGSPIKKWTDLKGKRIAGFSPTCEAVLAYDVKARAAHAPFSVVTLSGPAALAALEAGTIDGAILEEPDSGIALRTGFRAVLTDASQQGGCRTVTARSGIVRGNPDAVRRLVMALQEANELIRRNPTSHEWLRIARIYTDVPSKVFPWDGRKPTFTTRIDEKSLKALAEELVRLKLVRENPGDDLYATELRGITWGR
jgi:NitT/TauT family transport system substrate-binding protein